MRWLAIWLDRGSHFDEVRHSTAATVEADSPEGAEEALLGGEMGMRTFTARDLASVEEFFLVAEKYLHVVILDRWIERYAADDARIKEAGERAEYERLKAKFEGKD